jgi:DNA-binding Lrp family transcriptional regulator
MLNDKEKQLILKLRQNSRVNINDVAKQLNYATSTMYDLLHRLEEKKIVTHISRVAFERIGFPIKTYLIVKTTPIHRDQLKKYLQEKACINSLCTVNHQSSFHVECIFRNQKDLEEFLEELEERHTLAEIHVYNVLEMIHVERFLTEAEHFKE